MRRRIITALLLSCLGILSGCIGGSSSTGPPVPTPSPSKADFTSDTFYPGAGTALAATTNARLGGAPKNWSLIKGSIKVDNTGTEASAYAYADILDAGMATATLATGYQNGTIEFTFVKQPGGGNGSGVVFRSDLAGLGGTWFAGSDGSQYQLLKYVGSLKIQKSAGGASTPQNGDRLQISYSGTDTVAVKLRKAGERAFSTILSVSDADDTGTPGDLQNSGAVGLFFQDTTAEIGKLEIKTVATPLTSAPVYPSGFSGGGSSPPDPGAYPMLGTVFHEICTLPTMSYEAPIDGEVTSLDGVSTLGTRSLYHCTAVVMYGRNAGDTVIFNLHHYNAPSESTLLTQRQRLIDAGALPATIETYAAGGGAYLNAPGNWTVIQYGPELNLISVAFNLFGDSGDDSFYDVIDITATPTKEIYIRKRADCP